MLTFLILLLIAAIVFFVVDWLLTQAGVGPARLVAALIALVIVIYAVAGIVGDLDVEDADARSSWTLLTTHAAASWR